MTEAELRKRLCEAGRELAAKSLIGATEGNLSARLEGDRLLATPSGVSKAKLTPGDLVVIDLAHDASVNSGASSEIRLHQGIYVERPDCQAVVHAHPIYATALTLSQTSFRNDVLPEAWVVLGEVLTAPFAMPGTHQVPDLLRPLLPRGKTFLLSHHGAVTLGKTLDEALYRMETLERIAQTFSVAGNSHDLISIPLQALQELRNRYPSAQL